MSDGTVQPEIADAKMHEVIWEWETAAPSKDEAMVSLRTVPLAHGIQVSNYAAHVLPMPKKQKKVDSSGRQIDVMVWKLYMQVAGRLSMLNAAAELHKWRVDFEPEPLIMGEKFVVYREFIAIYTSNPVTEESDGWSLLGRRPGMAAMRKGGYVPPIEKMETAARGRALGAWGFGILPGSGIASLDEMELAAIPGYEPGEGDAQGMPTREQMEERTLIAMERIRQAKGEDDDVRINWIRGRALGSFGVELPVSDEGVLDFGPLKDAQMYLLMQFCEQAIEKALRTLGG